MGNNIIIAETGRHCVGTFPLFQFIYTIYIEHLMRPNDFFMQIIVVYYTL